MTWQVDKLSTEHGINFDPDCRQYLETVGAAAGGLFGWQRSASGEPESAPMLKDVPDIFGIMEMFAYYGAPDSELHFWDRKLLQHAYVIAKSYGGDPVVQVTQGKHAGKVLLTNHEGWFGGFEFLAGIPEGEEDEADEFAEVAGLESAAELGQLTTDQVVDILLNEELDGATVLGDSFPAFHRNLLAAQGKALGVTVKATDDSAPGEVTLIPEGGSWKRVAELLDVNFYDLLEEADLMIGAVAPGLVIHGDVHVSQSIQSKELLLGTKGHATREGHYFVLILGDLIVDGDLEVVQYHDLVVRGSIKARSIKGYSSNLFATGAITAEQPVFWEESDEGGVLWGATLTTPLYVRLGTITDVELEGEHRIATSEDRDEELALREAVAELGGPQLEWGDFHELHTFIAQIIAQGKGDHFVAAYVKALEGKK